MSRFKIGQKVVSLASWDYFIKKGEIVEVELLGCCPKCGASALYFIGITALRLIGDSECGYKSSNKMRVYFNQKYFAPLQNNADAIEYKMKVSIPELLTIKEYQEQ